MPDPTASPAASTTEQEATPAPGRSASSVAPQPTASETERPLDDTSLSTAQPSSVETSQAQYPAQDDLPGVIYWGAG